MEEYGEDSYPYSLYKDKEMLIFEPKHKMQRFLKLWWGIAGKAGFGINPTIDAGVRKS